MRKIKLLSSAILMSLIAPALYASDAPATSSQSNWYANINLIGSLQNTLHNSDTVGNSLKTTFQTGYGISAAEGYDFKDFSLEFELAYIYNSVDKVQINGQNAAGSTGYMGLFAGLLNGIYRFNNSSNFVPYLGIGVGGGQVQNQWSAEDTYVNGKIKAHGNGGVFAYQGIAGLGYKFNQQWMINLDYRYLGTSNATYKMSSPTVTDSVNNAYKSNTINLGFIYHFK